MGESNGRRARGRRIGRTARDADGPAPGRSVSCPTRARPGESSATCAAAPVSVGRHRSRSRCASSFAASTSRSSNDRSRSRSPSIRSAKVAMWSKFTSETAVRASRSAPRSEEPRPTPIRRRSRLSSNPGAARGRRPVDQARNCPPAPSCTNSASSPVPLRKCSRREYRLRYAGSITRLTIQACLPTCRTLANPYCSNSSAVALNRNRL